jgi:FixJ family two-component response regulator
VNAPDHIIYVVDDEPSVREAIYELVSSQGLHAVTYGSVSEYMQAAKQDVPACLILDVQLPDMNGLEFQRQRVHTEHPPIVFITGHGDIPSSVRAMKAGAVDFLPKPFSQEDLLTAIGSALAQDRETRRANAELSRLHARYSALTPRERSVLPLIVSGLLNKQAAAELGISEVTLQIHRSHVMRKMAADSLSDLVRMSAKLGIPIHTCGRRG